MKKLILALCFLVTFSYAGEFISSFGNGGISNYSIVDNTCSVYVINYEKIKNALPQAINQMIITSIRNAKKAYLDKGDGYINITTNTNVINGRIIYQVCGDIIRRK